MNNMNRQNKKRHIGRRLLAVLICLLTIMPMVGSALPEFTDMVGGIAESLGGTKRPSAGSYSEGAVYLDDFLKEHPDATVFGRDDDLYGKDQARPTAIGTPGDRIDPAWFQLRFRKIGGVAVYPLDDTGYTLDEGNGTFWDVPDMDGFRGDVHILYPDPDSDYAKYNSTIAGDDGVATKDTSSWPISGYMNWNDYGFVDGGNYPILSSRYDGYDADYGITSAYLGESRVYNVGVIAVGTEKRLWVSIDESGEDNGVIVLPSGKPENNVILNYGPREYPVHFDIQVKDLDGKTYALDEADEETLKTLWGTTNLDDIRFAVYGDYLPSMTSGKTATFNVTVPAGTYGHVSWTPVTDDEELDDEGNPVDNSTTIYPSIEIYGENPVGSEPGYAWQYDTDEREGWYEEASITRDGKATPDRYSLSEPYVLGAKGTISSETLVTVTVERRTDFKLDTYFVEAARGGTTTGFSSVWNVIDKGKIGNSNYSYLYTLWDASHYKNIEYNADGSYNLTLMFSLPGGTSGENGSNLNGFEVNGVGVDMPENANLVQTLKESDTDLEDGSSVHIMSIFMDTQDTGAKNFDNFIKGTYTENGKTYPGYNQQHEFDNMRYQQLSNPNKVGYVIEFKNFKRDIVFTLFSHSPRDTNRLSGKLYIRKAAGVDVELWDYHSTSSLSPSQSVRAWESYAQGSMIRIRWHADSEYQHGRFRYWDGFLSPFNIPDNTTRAESAYQMYSIRVKPSVGYGWAFSDLDGKVHETEEAVDEETGETNTTVLDQILDEIVGPASYYFPATSKEGDKLTLSAYGQYLFDRAKVAYNNSGLNNTRTTTANNNSVKNLGTNLGLSTETTTVRGTNDNGNYITFTYNRVSGAGTFSAYVNRTAYVNGTTEENSNTTYNAPANHTFAGTWTYQDGTLTLTYTRTGNNDYYTTTTITPATLADGNLTFDFNGRYLRNRNTRYGDYTGEYDETFTISEKDITSLIYPDYSAYPEYNVWYYSYLDTLPQFSKTNGRRADLSFEAVRRTYDVKYNTGVIVDEQGKVTTLVGPNSKYDITEYQSVFSLDKRSMPYWQDAYTDQKGYSKAEGYQKFFQVSGANPTDGGDGSGRLAFHFLYWVLTDAEGNPVDENGMPIVMQDGEEVEDWQKRFVTFEPGASVMLSALGDGYERMDDIFDIATQKFTIHLTACWSAEPQMAYTNFITANIRADIKDDGTTETKRTFEGQEYNQSTGGKWSDDTSGGKMIIAVDSRTEFIDLNSAGAELDEDGNIVIGPTATIDKDALIEYMGKLEKKYKWLTYDDEMNGWSYDNSDGTEKHIINGTFQWADVKDLKEVPVWFRYSLGGVKINTDIDGYDQPLPYKLTFTLPTYEGEDRKPLVFEADGSVLEKNWDPYDYRYTYGKESEFFGTDGVYSVAIQLVTGEHTGATEKTADGRTVLLNTNYKAAKDGDGKYLFLTGADDGAVKVENYLGNETVFENVETDGTATLKLTRDPADPTGQTYYAIIYLGKGDSITIPELPEKTTYGLAIHNVYEHPDFDPKDNPSYEDRHKYDGYVMESAKKNEDETSTIWTKTNTSISTDLIPVLEGAHNDSKNYFNVALTADNLGFNSAKYEVKDNEDNVTATYKGINAYDTQVINVTSKGTYTIYLDQYTIQSEDPDGADPGDWSDGHDLQVQNFNYLSYISTARNLTNTDQTLQITLKVGTNANDLRYLGIAALNGELITWNPEDGDLDPEVLSGTTTFELSDGSTSEGTWEYDPKQHAVIFTVQSVPAGVSVAPIARTTVPAVNTETTYGATADLESLTDTYEGEDGEKHTVGCSSNEVTAYVFSNWLRIAAFVGSGDYVLTYDDLAQKFYYTVTLSNPEGVEAGTGPISEGNIIRYMLFKSSADYGTQNAIYVNVTIDELNSDGSFTFELKGTDEEGKDLLMHDWRIVIYEIFDENEETLEPDDGEYESLNGVQYTVRWDAHDGQNGRYSVYLNAYDGGETLGVRSAEYTGTIAHDSIDMVVYRYMPIADLEVGKTVVGQGEDLNRKWTFDIKLSNDDLNQLDASYTILKNGAEVTEGITWVRDNNQDSPTYGDVTLTITLVHGETITIKGLPQGTRYVVTEHDVSGVNFSTSYVITDGDVTNKDGTDTAVGVHASAPGKVAEGMVYKYQKKLEKDATTGEEVWKNVLENGMEKPAYNIVAFTNSMSGDLTIEKVVPNYNDEAEAEPSFTFEITLTDANGAAVSGTYKDADGKDVKFENGKATVTISKGAVDNGTWTGSMTIKALPNGTHYEVAETGYGTEYIPSYVGKTGNITGNGDKVTCTNDKTGSLTIQKVVDGKSGSKIDDFTFTITFTDLMPGTSYDVDFDTMEDITDAKAITQDDVAWGQDDDGNVTATFTLAHGQQITIVGLPAGTKYTVAETVDGSYTTKVQVGTGEAQKIDCADGKVTVTPDDGVALWTDGGTTVTYTNERSGTTPSGIMMAFAWMIPLLLVAIGGVTAIVLKNRKRAAI